jgi:hypothetical protein
MCLSDNGGSPRPAGPNLANHQSIVLRMSTDPEPHYAVISGHTQSAVVKPNPNGEKSANTLEME